MDNNKKKYRATDKKVEKFDHGFDQFWDEEEIDINTFVLSPRKCGLCTLPFPFEGDRIVLKPCCGNEVCRACEELTFYGELKRRLEDEGCEDKLAIDNKCQFCREIPPDSSISALEKLIEKGNSEAIVSLADAYQNGDEVTQDLTRAIELFHTAARAGSSTACRNLAYMYWQRESFDDIGIQKDTGKAMRLFIRGAKLGDPPCLHNVGVIRCEKNKDDYVQYFIKAAAAGLQDGLDEVKQVLWISSSQRRWSMLILFGPSKWPTMKSIVMRGRSSTRDLPHMKHWTTLIR